MGRYLLAPTRVMQPKGKAKRIGSTSPFGLCDMYIVLANRGIFHLVVHLWYTVCSLDLSSARAPDLLFV